MSKDSGRPGVTSARTGGSGLRVLATACVLLTTTTGSAIGAPITYYAGAFAINEADPERDAARYERQDFDQDAGAAISGSPRADANDTFLNATYSVWGSPAASASSTTLKSETWIGYDLGLGWSSARARVRTGAEFSDTVDILWGGIVPQAGYALEFDWSIDGAYEARLTSMDVGFGVSEFQFMRYQYIASTDVIVNWSLQGEPFSNSATVFAGDLHRTQWEHTQPFMRGGLEFLPLGGNAGTPLTGVEHRAASTQPRVSNTITIPVGTSESMDLVFMLQTAVNLGLYNVDFSGGLNGNLTSLFSNTAQLTAVRLVDDGGAPVPGNWSLQSRSGAVYPFERVPQPVPEPAGTALVGFGLLVMGARAVRRRQGSADARG